MNGQIDQFYRLWNRESHEFVQVHFPWQQGWQQDWQLAGPLPNSAICSPTM
jgi:hypothetical protein